MTRLILTFISLAIIGGAVSYLGNQLGRYIGRKKMSILNLRPRHTSILITTLTGSFIAVMTLAFAYASSWEVRTLFTGLQKFQQEISSLTAKAIEQEQTGGVLYRPGEPLLTAVVDGSKTPEEIKSQLEAVLAYANSEAMLKSKNVAETMKTTFNEPPNGKIVGYHKDELATLIEAIHKIKGRVIVKPAAESYAFLGEKFSVRLTIQSYIPKVFDENEIVISGMIDGSKRKEDVVTQISKLLVEAKITALRKGMIENPITYKLLEIDRNKLTETIDEIYNSKKICEVSVIAQNATDNRGPLDVYLTVK